MQLIRLPVAVIVFVGLALVVVGVLAGRLPLSIGGAIVCAAAAARFALGGRG